MAITVTKKFTWTDGEGETRIYFPGAVIEDQSAGAWAIMQKHAEERGEQIEARAMRGAPENKAAGAPTKSAARKGQKRLDDGDGTPVLGTEDEIDQES